MAASSRSANSSMLSHLSPNCTSISPLNCRRFSRSNGICRSVAARATRSLGDARNVLIRAAIRSVSEMFVSSPRMPVNLASASLISSTASCRSSIAARSQSGMHSQFLNMRAPMPVMVSSRHSSSEPFLLSVRIVRRTSRLRRLVGSICRKFRRLIFFRFRMWPSVVFCVSFRYSTMAPAGGISPSSSSPMPNPSSVAVPKCLSRRCLAW